MKRIWVSLLLLAVVGCALFAGNGLKPTIASPQRGFSYVPPLVYLEWFQEAHSCALTLKRLRGDSAGFTVDSTAVDILSVTWIAVPTERFDRAFVVRYGLRDSLLVWGLTAGTEDTVWMPAPLINAKSFVKHEAMHIFVDSPGEAIIGNHGLPWGFCEYV